MITLLAAYACAATIIGAYAVWLVIGTSRLAHRLHQLKSLRDNKPDAIAAKRIA